MRILLPVLVFFTALSLGGCHLDNTSPEGLELNLETKGPQVVFDLDAEPLPEIPFPNDLATRLDATSPTGRRLNISTMAPTKLESELRGFADKIDGWGTFSQISVRFDAEIDATDVWNRQQTRDLGDDALYVVNVDPTSPGFGEYVPLDVGGGRFPFALENRSNYFPNDTRKGESNLIFETVNEDLNGDGILQPEEDTDFDGVLDHANLFPGGTNTVDDLMTFYESQTHTLIVRPVRPLRERTTYAVVLTKRIVGVDEEPNDGIPASPIRSPFRYINHTRQTEALAPLEGILADLGVKLELVAFTWTFTTQSTTHDLEMIRRGMYGDGPMAWLEAAYPPDMTHIDAVRGPKSKRPRHMAYGEDVANIVEFALGAVFDGVSEESKTVMREGMLNVDYIVAGSFDTPYFLTDTDGLANADNPQDDDEVWDIDPVTGETRHAPQRVTWWCAVPRKELNPNPGQPFPVVFYSHGYTSARLEMLGFAGSHARAGLATCAFDAQGHGLVLDKSISENPLVKILMDTYDLQMILTSLTHGRARDLNNDTVLDAGGDYWSANTFHTRDVVRQSVVDWMMMVRILRSFDGTRRWKLTDDEDSVALVGIAGDFDGDGKVDIGGWDNDYYAWGQSLGGFLATIALAVEPAITAGAPVAGGGGLLDVSTRTTQGGVVQAVWLRLLGPLIVAQPNPEKTGYTDLFWWAIDVNDDRGLYIATLGPNELAPGDTLRATNLRSGEHDTVRLDENHQARLAVAADAMSPTEKRARLKLPELTERFIFEGRMALDMELGDPFEIEVFDGETAERKRVVQSFEGEEPVKWQGTFFGKGSSLVAPSEGFGFKRQSPALRRFLGLGQAIVDAADPANYAALFQRPIDYSDIEPRRSMQRRALVIATLGDSNVPVSTGIAIARAAGYIGQEVDPRYGKSQDELLIDNYVVEGIAESKRFGEDVGVMLYDADDLDNDTDGYDAPSPADPLRITVTNPDGSMSGLRLPFIFPKGEHGFMVQSPEKPFDIDTFMVNQITWYFQSKGRVLSDEPCLATSTCDFFKPTPQPREGL